MDLIGKDVSEKILNELSPIDLVKFCSAWKEGEERRLGSVSQICFSQEFWRRRFLKDFEFFFNTLDSDILEDKFLSDPKKYYLEIFQIFAESTEEYYQYAKNELLESLWKHFNDEYKNTLQDEIFTFLITFTDELFNNMNRAVFHSETDEEWMDNSPSSLLLFFQALDINGPLYFAADYKDDIPDEINRMAQSFAKKLRNYLVSIFPKEFQKYKTKMEEKRLEAEERRKANRNRIPVGRAFKGKHVPQKAIKVVRRYGDEDYSPGNSPMGSPVGSPRSPKTPSPRIVNYSQFLRSSTIPVKTPSDESSDESPRSPIVAAKVGPSKSAPKKSFKKVAKVYIDTNDESNDESNSEDSPELPRAKKLPPIIPKKK
jgi:hypothetical protein